MRKYITPPRLTTSFSESGKSAKRRFANILDTRTRRIGAAVIIIALVAAIAAGAVIAFDKGGRRTGPTPESEVGLAERLFETKHAYVGDASANGRTASALGISAVLGAFTNELHTSDEPYGWRLNFKTNTDKSIDPMSNYAVVLMALVDNLGYVEWTYPGNSAAARLTAEGASEIIGRDVKSAAKTEADLEELLLQLGFHDRVNEIYTALTEAPVEDFVAGAFAVRRKEIQNVDKLRSFLEALNNKTPAELDIVQRTVEGDPILIRALTDGENCWMGEYYGYDRFMGTDSPTFYGYGPYEYLKIFVDDSYAGIYLTNDENLTYDDIMKHYLSSVYNPDPGFVQVCSLDKSYLAEFLPVYDENKPREEYLF